MNITLPKSVTVGGKQWRIRTDFRDVLQIISAFNDPDVPKEEKALVCLVILYPDFDRMPQRLYEEALQKAVFFIDLDSSSEKETPRVMDWEQDAGILFPAVNKVAGFEVRSVRYLHWWTFMGYCMAIDDGVFSQVLSLRMKRAKGKRLEKYEKEYWLSNLDICELRPKLSAEEQAEKDRKKAVRNKIKDMLK